MEYIGAPNCECLVSQLALCPADFEVTEFLWEIWGCNCLGIKNAISEKPKCFWTQQFLQLVIVGQIEDGGVFD
jgi:hypothetical protein